MSEEGTILPLPPSCGCCSYCGVITCPYESLRVVGSTFERQREKEEEEEESAAAYKVNTLTPTIESLVTMALN
jgi:hypothetical protein